MNTKILKDAELGEFEFRHAWIGKCSVAWNNTLIPLKIRMISSEDEALTTYQRSAAIAFVHSPTAVLIQCREELDKYSRKVYAEQFVGKSVEDVFTPRVILFERKNEYGLLFKCEFEEEVNIAVKFNGAEVEVGTDDILL